MIWWLMCYSFSFSDIKAVFLKWTGIILYLWLCVHIHCIFAFTCFPLHVCFCAASSRCVSICSLAFSMEGLYLSASSNTETVHIFKLETQKEKYVYVPFRLCWISWNFLPIYLCLMFLQEKAGFSHSLCLFVCVCVGQQRSPPRGEDTWARSWWHPPPICLPRLQKCSPRGEPLPPYVCPSAGIRTSAP